MHTPGEKRVIAGKMRVTLIIGVLCGVSLVVLKTANALLELIERFARLWILFFR